MWRERPEPTSTRWRSLSLGLPLSRATTSVPPSGENPNGVLQPPAANSVRSSPLPRSCTTTVQSTPLSRFVANASCVRSWFRHASRWMNSGATATGVSPPRSRRHSCVCSFPSWSRSSSTTSAEPRNCPSTGSLPCVSCRRPPPRNGTVYSCSDPGTSHRTRTLPSSTSAGCAVRSSSSSRRPSSCVLIRTRASAAVVSGCDRRELRNDLVPVRPKRLLLALRHEVDVELVDANRFELLQLLRSSFGRPQDAEAIDDLVGHELAVPRADARVLAVVVELARLHV